MTFYRSGPMGNSASEGWRHYCCGLYYTLPYNNYLEKVYLPQVDLQAHATILSTVSKTVLTQTFVNPSERKGIKETRYTFPLYDGVSVVGFTCRVGDRTIVGEVKEKEEAKAIFQESVAKGETAGLLEQLPDASDVFTTTVGNIPPGAKVTVQITYLGELKHDMEVDGIRFTIPNVICPRYGKYPLDLTETSIPRAEGTGISITVDAEMTEGSFIQKITSPSHPVSVSMGTTSLAPNAEPTMAKASATLSLGICHLDADFVLQVVAKDSGVPKAIFEIHPTIPNQRALMTTLVPKFALPPEKPEVVFLCDRSGSMAGSRIKLVVQALKVFLKSLPVGVKFNICSFGSSHRFLWPNSKTYNQQSLNEATQHLQNFDANMGGTEMFRPLKATIDSRYKDIPLEVMLLTDGEIWDQQSLFDYLNKEVTQSRAPIRIFTLGIGNGVSHSLIEGVARAGNGFSQSVGEGEKMDSKVVRMLKGALSPHVNDYELEIKYSDKTVLTTTNDKDDFEMVEKVADSLKISLALEEKHVEREATKPISLFDASIDIDEDDAPKTDMTGETKYSHLPKIPVPSIIQAPQQIPSLFSFTRTTVYLLFGPGSSQEIPKSVVLRGTSAHGPLELEIPVQVLETPGDMVHQLAAKKAIAELEEGRGWLSVATDETDTPIKQKFPSRFDDIVEREAVRLGVGFQVGGRWCSFVAVEKNKPNNPEEDDQYDWLDHSTEISEGSAGRHTDKSSVNTDASHLQAPRLISLTSAVRRPSGIDRLSTKSNGIDTNSTIGMKRFRQRMALSSTPTNKIAAPRTHQSAFAGAAAPLPSLSPSMEPASFSSAYAPGAAPAVPSMSPSMGASPPPLLPPQGLKFDRLQLSAFPLQNSGLQTQQQQQQQQQRQQVQARPAGGLYQAHGASTVSSAMNTPPSNDLYGITEQFVPQSSIISKSDKVDDQIVSSKRARLLERVMERGERLDSLSTQSGSPSRDRAVSRDGVFGRQGGAMTSTSSGKNLEQKRAASPPAPAQLTRAAALTSSLSARKSSYQFDDSDEDWETPSSGTAPASGLAHKKPQTEDEILDALIALQSFEGFWEWSAALFDSTSISEAAAEKELQERGWNKEVLATALAIACFEEKLAGLRGSWELVVDKARDWLGDKADNAVLTAKELLKL